MKAGDQLRFRGPAGAPFVVTVGAAFSADYINAQVKAGEWTPLEDGQEPVGKPAEGGKKPAPRRARSKTDD